MIEELAKDYANFVKVDLENELRDVQVTIDDMLLRLDEFENVLTMIKKYNELCTEISIPIILQSKEKLDSLCDKVDSLEKLVDHVMSDMKLIDTQVKEAEEGMGQTSGKLKNIFKPFFSKKSTDVPEQPNQVQAYEPPTLFMTSSFFPPPTEDSVQEVQKT